MTGGAPRRAVAAFARRRRPALPESAPVRGADSPYRDTTSSTPATTRAEQPSDQSVSVSPASR